MNDEPKKEGRPSSLAEGTDPDVPQDPGIPGQKAEEDQGTEWEPSSPATGFPEDADAEQAADADNTIPPGAMPPEDES